MKLVKSKKTIIPKVRLDEKWLNLGEKIFIGKVWIKLNYYNVYLTLDRIAEVSIDDKINMQLSFEYHQIA